LKNLFFSTIDTRDVVFLAGHGKPEVPIYQATYFCPPGIEVQDVVMVERSTAMPVDNLNLPDVLVAMAASEIAITNLTTDKDIYDEAETIDLEVELQLRIREQNRDNVIAGLPVQSLRSVKGSNLCRLSLSSAGLTGAYEIAGSDLAALIGAESFSPADLQTLATDFGKINCLGN